MTELENHLLNALKRLEKQFNEQHKASEDTQFALRMMFEHTSEENKNLRHQVNNLSKQVMSLSEQLQQFAKLYNINKR
jgi:predicted RNase H-like nuclease (RuvC/YqgF family)